MTGHLFLGWQVSFSKSSINITIDFRALWSEVWNRSDRIKWNLQINDSLRASAWFNWQNVREYLVPYLRVKDAGSPPLTNVRFPWKRDAALPFALATLVQLRAPQDRRSPCLHQKGSTLKNSSRTPVLSGFSRYYHSKVISEINFDQQMLRHCCF